MGTLFFPLSGIFKIELNFETRDNLTPKKLHEILEENFNFLRNSY